MSLGKVALPHPPRVHQSTTIDWYCIASYIRNIAYIHVWVSVIVCFFYFFFIFFPILIIKEVVTRGHPWPDIYDHVIDIYATSNFYYLLSYLNMASMVYVITCYRTSISVPTWNNNNPGLNNNVYFEKGSIILMIIFPCLSVGLLIQIQITVNGINEIGHIWYLILCLTWAMVCLCLEGCRTHYRCSRVWGIFLS